MPHRPAVTRANLGIVAIVFTCAAVGVLAVTRIDRTGETGSGLGEAFDYQSDAYKTVDPTLVG